MKTAVIGAGGVGGFLTAVLAKYDDDITLVARGDRGAYLAEHGLTMESEARGTYTVYPKIVSSVSELEEQDLILVCVKNYSLEEVCRDLKGVVTPSTVIMPVMNGVDPGDRIREMLPGVTVIDSLIYIVAFARGDYSILHDSPFGNIFMGISGETTPEDAAVLEKVHAYLNEASGEIRLSTDIRKDIWKKYILNCSFNVATAAQQENIGPLRDDPVKAQEFVALTEEAYQLGLALGVNLTQHHLENIVNRFYNEYPDTYSSSLQRDIAAGKRAEIETFSGYVVKTAEKLGMDVPVSRKYYEMLLERTGQESE